MDKALKLDQLIDGAEELLINLADAHDPAIQRLRDRVDHSIRDARRSFARDGDVVAVRFRDLARTVDDYVRDFPWIALGTGMLLAATMAFLAGVTLGSTKAPTRR